MKRRKQSSPRRKPTARAKAARAANGPRQALAATAATAAILRIVAHSPMALDAVARAIADRSDGLSLPLSRE